MLITKRKLDEYAVVTSKKYNNLHGWANFHIGSQLHVLREYLKQKEQICKMLIVAYYSLKSVLQISIYS